MFRWVSYAGAAVFLYVGLVLLVAPSWQIETLGITLDRSGQIMGRRSAPLFFCVGALALIFAHQPVSAPRTAFASAWAGALLLVAAIGLWDLQSGRVTSAVLTAVTVETLLGVGLLATMRRA